MYVKRDGSVQGPLWPRDIIKIVEDKYMKASLILSILNHDLIVVLCFLMQGLMQKVDNDNEKST